MLGKCRLCLREADLQHGHIIPAWAYKRSRDEAFANPNPVIVSEGVAVQHSKQVRQYLLCFECEQKFSQREQYVSSVTYQRDARAPLLDLIGNVVFEHERMRVALPGKVDLAALVYFGASVVWRASISAETDRCHLGAVYDEQFRSYLNGEAPFPPGAACCVAFHDLPIGEQHVASVTSTPVTRRLARYHLTMFPIFGLQFWFPVGSRVDQAWRGACAVRGEVATIMLLPQSDLLDWFGPIIATARRVGTPGRLKGA
jgi:hypothetical protein